MTKFIPKIFILLIIVSNTSNAQHVQRFFTTQEQRSILDLGDTTLPFTQILKTTETQEKLTLNTPSNIAESVHLNNIMATFNGLVIREKQQHTIWLNEHPFSVNQLPPDISIDHKNNRLKQVFGNGSSKQIKLGQQFRISDLSYIRKYSNYFTLPAKTEAETSESALETSIEQPDMQITPASALVDIQSANKTTEPLLEQL